MTIDTGIPSDYLLPGHFMFQKYGGAFGPAADQRKILVVGPKTTSGTATVNTLYTIKDDNHVDQLSGIGGPVAAAARAARALYNTASIVAIFATDHGSGVAASGDITPSGTATTDGDLTVKVAGRTYTGSIETGDTPEMICEKINLLINPTKLEMAMRLANELKGDYNTHKASAVYHTVGDPGNTVAAADATDLASLVTLANAIRTAYEAHRVLVGGGPCHGAADTANAISAAVCTDLATAVVLLKDEKAKYEAHRINVSGAPPVHIASDVTDVIRAEDPIDEVNPHLPVTSKVVIATPKVTLTARFKGTMGNQIFVRASTDAGGVTIACPTGNYLASGANEPDYSSAYAVALQNEYAYVVPVTNVGSILAAATTGLKDRLTAAEQADVGLLMQAVLGHNVTPSEGETLCDTLDYYRMGCVSIETDTPPWEMAGALAGLRCKAEGSDLSVNLAGRHLIGVVAPEDPADNPGSTELNNALHQGLTLCRVNDAGEVLVTYPITTRHTNGSGQKDLSVWGTVIVTVGDAVAKYIRGKAALRFDGWKLMADPTDEQTPIPYKTMTPKRFKPFVYECLKKFETDGHLVKVDDYKDQIFVEINGSNPNRLDYRWPWECIKHLLTTAGLGEQVG